ncbi:MAG: hypothetical protein DSM106950_35790 [Stigonema ocellatum SAG 48.90 = DSM 106950]|nr:hypothetical protein [Stigonema ocellatum SAG 48.90 = DSM 106950]
MTQDRDRLDRIEASLDRQVAVNAELRATAEALLTVVNVHQQNFERLAVELNADRQQAAADRQQVAIDRQAWQAEIGRIWEYLLQQGGNGRSGEKGRGE